MSYERSSAVFIRPNIVAKVTKKTADYYQFFYTGIVLRPNIKFQVVYFLDIIMADQPCQINTYFYCCFEQMYQFSFLFVTECNLQHLKVPSTLLEIMKKSQKLINELKQNMIVLSQFILASLERYSRSRSCQQKQIQLKTVCCFFIGR